MDGRFDYAIATLRNKWADIEAEIKHRPNRNTILLDLVQAIEVLEILMRKELKGDIEIVIRQLIQDEVEYNEWRKKFLKASQPSIDAEKPK